MTAEQSCSTKNTMTRYNLKNTLLLSALTAGMIVTPTTLNANTAQKAPAVTVSQAEQQAMTPEQAFAKLKKGHARFLAGKNSGRDFRKQVANSGKGQFPFATILSCIDSRTPAEYIFDLKLGDSFSPRIAGNFVNTDILGSMEFTAAAAGSRLVVVMGHSACGAVMGACDDVKLGNLTATLENLKPAVNAIEYSGDRSSKNKKFVDKVTAKNVALTMQNIRQKSEVLRDLESAGKLMIVGAVYDVSTGSITWLK